ncbi:hypothetical protein [Streptosporangium pseudovulgare]|uniref:WXG100 family type VII secretion target n=1 Tax=Streptosporangium pseudovulgare TaxID=35765 RepID=A0ABQ2R9Y7_9ACTN|nr:hypothetical protein [Streptosporangium pseudovulgare]GGQ17595.1 hypothetical protein GCM10010140_54820 [Streptosporangium pseudovulgare]
MTEVLRFDRSLLSGAGQGMLDAAADFERHTGGLLATVRGTGDTAWGGTSTGAAMDRLGDLLDDVCRLLHSHLHQTGDGIRGMADDLRRTEADISAVVQDPGASHPGRPA